MAGSGKDKTVPETSDQDLLALTAGGDQVAFARLLQRHQGRVYALAFRFSRDRQDAEELAQEIFLKVWRHARTFKGRAAFSTWLYRLAVNTCLSHRHKKKNAPGPLPLPDDLAGTSETAADGIVARERAKLLARALDALPGRQKMALILANFEGKSYEQIALIMAISVSAVETLLFRARRNLGKMLRPAKE